MIAVDSTEMRRLHAIRFFDDTPPMSRLETRAMKFAIAAHAGQKRKGSEFPYIVHPKAVAKILRAELLGTAILAAAWLHDVLEDTSASATDLEHEFGAEIAMIVRELTKSDTPEETLKALARASPMAKAVKCADIIDNLKDIEYFGVERADKYAAEKAQQLGAMAVLDTALGYKALHEVGRVFNWCDKRRNG